MADEPGGGLMDLASRVRGAGGERRALPPVHKWNPPHCGSIPMRIASDGTWFYQGTPIGRPALVQLFSTVLRREPDGEFVLVTPVEKVGIEVEDAPFVAVAMDVTDSSEGRAIDFATNVGDAVEVGPDHPIRFETGGGTGELKPYVHVRGELEALVTRAIMYDLVEHGETIEVDGVPMFALRSRGETYPIMPAADLERLSA